MLYNQYRWFLYIAITFFSLLLIKCVDVVKHKNCIFVLDTIRVAYVLDLGHMTPSLHRSKPPLIHCSTDQDYNLFADEHRKICIFLRVGLPFIPSLCFVKNWSLCCTLMWWNSYISNGYFFFFVSLNELCLIINGCF